MFPCFIIILPSDFIHPEKNWVFTGENEFSEIYFQANGTYHGSKASDLSSGTLTQKGFKSLIRGNIFTILPGKKPFLIRKFADRLIIEYERPTRGTLKITSSLQKILLKGKGPCPGTCNLSLQAEKRVIVHFTVLDNARKTVRLDSIQGLRLHVTLLARFLPEKIQVIFNPTLYRFILTKRESFFGVLKSSREKRFHYYVYTSFRDLKKRGLSGVLAESNQDIRRRLRPLVASFPDFQGKGGN